MHWEGQAAGAEDVCINVEAENQALVDWGSGLVPIPQASRGRIGRAGRPPLGLGGQAPALPFYKEGERRCLSALAFFSSFYLVSFFHSPW